MRTKTLLKLAFIALSTHQSVFAGYELRNSQDLSEEKNEVPQHLAVSEELLPAVPHAVVKTLSAGQEFCEPIPKVQDLTTLILQNLSKRDLKNVRLVSKTLESIATSILTNIQVKSNIPNVEQLDKFFKDLTTTPFWIGKKPSEAFVNFFREAPEKDLHLCGVDLKPEAIKILGRAFPSGLEFLSLNNSKITDERFEVLVQHLPAQIQELSLLMNTITDNDMKTLVQHLPLKLKSLTLSGNNNITDEGIKVLAQHLPVQLTYLYLFERNITNKGLAALLEAIPRTDLERLYIFVPNTIPPLHNQFKDLRNSKHKSVDTTLMQDIRDWSAI